MCIRDRGGVGRHLPGVHSAKVKEDHDSRAAHFAGGRVEVTVPASESFTVQFWMWNGVINNNITVNNLVAEWHRAHLSLANAKKDSDPVLTLVPGRVSLKTVEPRTWHLVTVVVRPDRYELWLNGEPVLDEPSAPHYKNEDETRRFVFGGSAEGEIDFHGKLDEIAYFDRALSAQEISSFLQKVKKSKK